MQCFLPFLKQVSLSSVIKVVFLVSSSLVETMLHTVTLKGHEVDILNLTDLEHQMGPSVNNLVPTIHNGHFKKKVQVSSPLVQIV